MTPGELRAVLTPIATQLSRIADAIEALIVMNQEPEPEPETPDCLHPMEMRADFGETDGQPDWQCRVCGYRTTTAS